MALTSSLRKTMLGLVAAMSCVVMFIYWNQNTMKPSNLVLSDPERTSKDNPTEKTWTYKCQNNRCVRHHYLGEYTDEKRVPFLTCTMKCGALQLWPQPTIKTTLGATSLNFKLDDVHLKLGSSFDAVNNLIKDAFVIFRREIKVLENRNSNSNYDTNSNSNSLRDKEQRTKYETVNENSERDDENVHETTIYEVKSKVRHDISQLLVYVHVKKSSDIHLTLQTDESYNLTLNHEKSSVYVKIDANTFFGARNGLATLQQLIWFDDEEHVLKILNKAIIHDAPKFHYRGLMLDTSRHYFSVEAIKRTLVGMAHSKLNRFHWHITDSQSFPFVSKFYPQLAMYGAYSANEVYTWDDIKELVEFARVRGIQIIPEIDAPAHAGNGWDWGPKYGLGELSLCINQQPWSFYCGEPPCGQLNPKNNNTYLILQKLYEEMIELMGPLDFFHLGGDEVNLECWGQHFNNTDLNMLWCDFMLQSLQRLKKANHNVIPKLVAVWSSGLTNYPCLSKQSFAVQIWGASTWSENYQLIDSGYNVLFSHVDAWYLDCGFGSWRATGEPACSPYRTWQTVYKHRPWDRMRLTSLQMKQILGGEACLWTEQVDESTLDSRLWPRAGALGERLWSDPSDDHDSDPVQKETFSRMSVFRNRLVSLGIQAEPIFPKYCAQNPDECV